MQTEKTTTTIQEICSKYKTKYHFCKAYKKKGFLIRLLGFRTEAYELAVYKAGVIWAERPIKN